MVNNQRPKPLRLKRQRRRLARAKANKNIIKDSKAAIKPALRSTDTIIRALRALKKPFLPRKMDPYVMCRVNPFHSGGTKGIPDGSNNNYIVVDSYCADTIATTSTNRWGFVIQTLPMLPALAGINSTVAMTINGIAVSAGAVQSPAPSSTTSSLYPLSITSPYQGTIFNPNAAAQDIYSSSAARLVAVGYKLIYTGPVNNCAGSITVTSNGVSFTNVGQGTAANNVIAYAANRTTAATTAAVGAPIVACDISINPTAMTQSSVTFRPEQGLMIIPRHRSKDFKLSPTRDVPAYILPNSSLTEIAASGANMLLSNGNYVGSVIWFDNDWESLQISASGLNSDASFRWETVSCFEYTLQVNSPYLPLAIAHSENNKQAIDRADAITNSKDVAQSFAEGRPSFGARKTRLDVRNLVALKLVLSAENYIKPPNVSKRKTNPNLRHISAASSQNYVKKGAVVFFTTAAIVFGVSVLLLANLVPPLAPVVDPMLVLAGLSL